MRKITYLKTMLLAIMLLVGSASAWGQTPFTATYTFTGTTGNVASFAYNGTSYAGITMGTIEKVGILTTSSTSNSRATGWPTGATSGSDVFSGSVDLGKYIGLTITPVSGYKYTVTSITFGIGRSATGTRQSQWRGSAGSYGSIIDNYTLASGLTNSSGELTNPDANSSWTGNVLSVGSSYSNITSSTGFRLYMYNSEATGGTCGLQGPITITGTYEATGGLTSPTLTADASSNDVENNIDITFTDDATWRTTPGIAVKIGGSTLIATTDYVLSSGNLQLIPSGGNPLLTTSGSKSVTVEATGYNTASVTQQINAGVATKLGMKTQPTAPLVNGGALYTQPALYVQDQYGNTTTSTATVVAAKGDAGTWTLGGTLSVAAVAGTTTFSGLTATSAAAVTGATISFTSDGLTGVISNSFNIPTPPPALPLYENFEYTVDTDLTANGWNITGSNSSPTVAVSASSISYSGYLSSGIGNEVTLSSLGGQDVNKTFVAQTSGIVYASFLVNVTSASTGGDYFFHLGPQTIGTTYKGRVFVKNDGSDNLSFGIAHTGGTAIYTSSAYSLNTTYLVVLKYTIVSGAANDLAAIYINPTLNAPEPTSGWIASTDTPTDPTDIGSVALRQGSGTTAPALKLDGIRISTSWTDIIGTIPTFSGTGDWSDDVRWNTASAPGTTDNVVIDGDATISSNVTVAGLTINSGKSLTVNAAKQLTVSGTATNNGTITIQSAINGTGTIKGDVTGAATVNQYLSSYRTWYMSSPVSNVAPGNMNRYKFYDETNNTWTTNAPAQTIGAGFLAVPTDNAVTSTSFSGNLNNGDISIPLTYTITNAVKAGFNLIGNPYPSYLDWTAVYTANSGALSTSTLWYRTKSGTYTFWTVNGESGVGSPIEASKYIPPMQAFWVRANGTGPLNLTNTLRGHAPDGGSLLKAPAANNNTLIRLEVSNGTNTDEAVLYLNDNASNGFDTYDSPKMSNDDPAIAEIFTRAGSERLVINGMQTTPKDTEIALGFEAGNASSFSLRANELRNLPSDVKVILKDNVTNVETNLTDGASYAFEPIATTADRFSVIFRTAGSVTGIVQPAYSGMVAYTNAMNQLTVLYDGAIDANTTVSVYNSVGQRMISKAITSNTTVIDGVFTSGVYVVKVNNMTHKVVVK